MEIKFKHSSQCVKKTKQVLLLLWWSWCTTICAINLVWIYCVKTNMRQWLHHPDKSRKEPSSRLSALSCLFVLDTDLFSFSRRARVHWSCSLSWCSRWASSMCCPQGESWSRAGLEWRRRYWSSSLSPPHRRQHTEPPAHSHQQHKAEPRTTWARPKQGKARKGITGRDTIKQDWTEWNGTLWQWQWDCARFTVQILNVL